MPFWNGSIYHDENIKQQVPYKSCIQHKAHTWLVGTIHVIATITKIKDLKKNRESQILKSGVYYFSIILLIVNSANF